jgi:hypothetical protein
VHTNVVDMRRHAAETSSTQKRCVANNTLPNRKVRDEPAAAAPARASRSTTAATDDLPYLAKLAARRRKAIAEGRDFWTAPHVLAAMHAHRLDPGEDVARIGRRRLPSWADAALKPLAGDWCSCCGKADRLGGRWWREATAPTGWRCSRCHPAAPGMSAVEVVT